MNFPTTIAEANSYPTTDQPCQVCWLQDKFAVAQSDFRSRIDIDGLALHPHCAQDVARRPNGDTYRDDNGVTRWISNDTVPPVDVLAQWFVGDADYSEDQFDTDKAAHEAETAAFLDAYRQRNSGRTMNDEALFEARAAFGPGVDVVDVVTGEVIGRT